MTPAQLAEARVAKLERSVHAGLVAILAMTADRDGLSLAIAQRAPPNRPPGELQRRRWFLPAPYRPDHFHRLAVLVTTYEPAPPPGK